MHPAWHIHLRALKTLIKQSLYILYMWQYKPQVWRGGKNGQYVLWLTSCLDCFIFLFLFHNKLQQTALASFLPSCENFQISCLLDGAEALGCFQFHFYGIWFLSTSKTVHPINSWQVYKLLFKQCQPLVLPMTNIIQIELYFFSTVPHQYVHEIKRGGGKKHVPQQARDKHWICAQMFAMLLNYFLPFLCHS